MKVNYETDLDGIDCHVHSAFSPDAKRVGVGTPQQIADAARAAHLRGFIVTDHIDVGHWQGCVPIDFEEYFYVWERVRADNPDLKILIGLEVGFERHTAEQTARLIEDLPLEYIINSVHFWNGPVENDPRDHYTGRRVAAYNAYLDAVLDSLDAPYRFDTIGHLGFPERFAPYDTDAAAMEYELFRDKLDAIIKKAVAKKIRFEENTNGGGEMKLPRKDFLLAYKAAGGIKPPLGSDAHVCATVGQYFSSAKKFLSDVFDKDTPHK